MELDRIIRIFALENALKYDGKANPGAVIGKVLAYDSELKKEMKTISMTIQQTIKEVNALSRAEQQNQYDQLRPDSPLIEKKEKKAFPDLPNAMEGKVVTRIPPEPSKYSHLGHALSFLINYTYAQKYKGKCLLRFEDTNPDKATQEYADSIIDDITQYLGIKPDSISYVSDKMELFYEKANELIKKDKAYVCFCDGKIMSQNRRKGINCCNEKFDTEQNLKHWQDMLDGKYKSGEAILRLVGDMKSKNHAMRDPVIFRIVGTPHYRQGTKYKVWPLYDFENSVMDATTGVTHILRSSEFGKMRIELQDYIKTSLDLPTQEVVQYGRFNIVGATTKGREIRELIKEGKVSGWDDPSLVTLKALKRRGIVQQTYYELIEEVGLSKNTAKKLDWSLLESVNRKIIDPKTRRYFFVEDPIQINIKGAPEQKVSIPLHPDDPKQGERVFTTHQKFWIAKNDHDAFRDGSLIRLKDCLNFIGGENKFHSIDYDTYKEKGRAIIHWLPDDPSNSKVSVLMPDHEIKKGLAEPIIKELEEGTIVHFTRFGFCRLDNKEKMQFIFTHS